MKQKVSQKHQQRTLASADNIITELRNVSETEFLSAVFLNPNTPFLKKLVRKIEFVLLDAIVNPNRFRDTLSNSLSTISDFIKEENKIKEFYILTNETMQSLTVKTMTLSSVQRAYYNLCIQLASSFVCPDGKMIAGFDSENKPLLVEEMYKDIDVITNRVKELAFNKNVADSYEFEMLYVKELRKNGYPVNNLQDIEMLHLEERIISNNLFLMAPFITDLDSPYFDKPYFYPVISPITPPYRENSVLKLRRGLKERKALLPTKGVLLEGEHPFGRLYLKEKMVNDVLYLTYSVFVDDRNYIGFYNTKTDFFYSPMTLAEENEIAFRMHKQIEKEVLTYYAKLTTKMDIDLNLNIKQRASIQDTNKLKSHLNKEELFETEAHVEAYIRKLPENQVASEEAKLLAEKYGIVLGDDETFVRPFEKTVYTIK